MNKGSEKRFWPQWRFVWVVVCCELRWTLMQLTVPVWRLSVYMLNTVCAEVCCKYRNRRKRCAFGSYVCVCLLINRMNDGRPQKCRHGGKKWSSVIRPGIGWLTAHFSIVDVSQTHHGPSLPALFVYPHLFLSDFQLPALVWLWMKIKMVGWEWHGVVRFQHALKNALFTSNMCTLRFVFSICILYEYINVWTCVLVSFIRGNLYSTLLWKIHYRDPFVSWNRFFLPPSCLGKKEAWDPCFTFWG